MARASFATLLGVFTIGCASGGGAPAGPIAWTPGHYYLEGTITYTSGAGNERDVHTADLYISADQSLRLDSHDAVCRDPTPPELDRDSAQGIRTFECGELTFVLRPLNESVRGELRAVVQEGRSESRCVLRDTAGNCTQSYSQITTRSVTKQARLRVAVEN
jgi:hypothetical protein